MISLLLSSSIYVSVYKQIEMKPSKTNLNSFASFTQGNRAIAEIQFADYIFPAFDQACL